MKQYLFRDVNNNVVELLILIYACKTSSSKSITVVMPYLPYSKQCKLRKRSSITAKLLADMICKAGLLLRKLNMPVSKINYSNYCFKGANKIITMDLYRKEIQGFFSVPVDNLRASPFLLQHIKEKVY